MALLHSQLHFLSEDDIIKIKRASIFICLFYVHWFLVSPFPVQATSNDLESKVQMEKFKTIDPEVATSVLKRLERHSWYLTPKFAIFSLVNEELDDTCRLDLAKKLLSFDLPGKEGKDQDHQRVDVLNARRLTDLISQDSWSIFLVLGIEESCDWLKEAVCTWNSYASYLRLKQFVEGIAVVNDTAERGVKLIQEYISSSRDESLRQDLLVTVKDFKSKLNHSNISKVYYYIWQGSKKQNFHK